MLMDMLDERGIDDAFINNMVEYATTYEQQLYLNFLTKLREVIQEKWAPGWPSHSRHGRL